MTRKAKPGPRETFRHEVDDNDPEQKAFNRWLLRDSHKLNVKAMLDLARDKRKP